MSGLPQQFLRATQADFAEVVVCTHNDADHANGLIGYLEGGLQSREVWLPGSWSGRLDDMVRDYGTFLEELASDILEVSIPTEGRRLEAFGNYVSTERNDVGESSFPSKSLESAFEELGEDTVDTWRSYGRLWDWAPLPLQSEIGFYLRTGRARTQKLRLLIEALEAADRIRRIAILAYHAGAALRWFQYNEATNNGGEPSFLSPVNSSEIVRVPAQRLGAFDYLALTTANRESLVFQSPADDSAPSVLFTADSDLSFPQSIAWENGMIVTAPHHGSEHNSNAYDRFHGETRRKLRVVWVRSDGRFRSRPGDSYLSASGTHFCTLCRGSGSGKQSIRLTSSGNQWTPVNSRPCHCT